jgi:hypothetical protein
MYNCQISDGSSSRHDRDSSPHIRGSLTLVTAHWPWSSTSRSQNGISDPSRNVIWNFKGNFRCFLFHLLLWVDTIVYFQFKMTHWPFWKAVNDLDLKFKVMFWCRCITTTLIIDCRTFFFSYVCWSSCHQVYCCFHPSPVVFPRVFQWYPVVGPLHQDFISFPRGVSKGIPVVPSCRSTPSGFHKSPQGCFQG